MLKCKYIINVYVFVLVYVMCRRGNDSQKAVKSLQEIFQGSNLEIKDVIGGIHAWSKKIDCTFPVY